MKDFANGVKVGDIIRAYRGGYHQVVAITPRFHDGYCLPKGAKVGDEYSSLIEYRTIMDAKFNLRKSQKTDKCDAAYCVVISRKEIEKEKKAVLSKIGKGYSDLLALLPL